MDQFVTGYRKGKFIQDKFNDITKKYESSDESLKKAVALKYQNFLSWRKYSFLAQIMDSFYDPSKKLGCKKLMALWSNRLDKFHIVK